MNRAFIAAVILVALGLSTGNARAEPVQSNIVTAPPPKNDNSAVAVKDALGRVDAHLADLQHVASAGGASPTAPLSRYAAPAQTRTSTTLAAIGTTAGEASLGAGKQTDAAPPIARSSVPRPMASPRALRRMDAERVIANLADDLHACFAIGPKDAKGGNVVVVVETKGTGEVVSATAMSRSGLTDEIAACVVTSVRAARFRPAGGDGVVLLVPVSLPR